MPDPPNDGFASLTHARLRAGQGDYRGAARLLREILERDPNRDEAQQLLLEIGRRPDIRAPSVQEERATPPPTPADPERLAGRFRGILRGNGFARIPRGRRARRLERWLHRIQRGA